MVSRGRRQGRGLLRTGFPASRLTQLQRTATRCQVLGLGHKGSYSEGLRFDDRQEVHKSLDNSETDK